MSRGKGRTRKVGGSEALSFLRKAEEFYQTMAEAHRHRRWNAAALSGIHCAISATDGLLGKRAHLRSAGQSHHEAVQLVRQYIQDERTEAQAGRLSRILSQKNLVEYESREFTEAEADTILRDVARYLEWVKSFFVG